MKKLTLILAIIGLISAIFATTMIIQTTNGNQEFELSEITNITFSNPITEGLVAYYPFNGNANDESSNGNDGVVYGSILTEDRFGNENSAYEFDGNSNYIEIENTANLIERNHTLCCWVYTSDDDGFLVGKGQDGEWNDPYAIYLANSKFKYNIREDYPNVYSIETTENIVTNEWYFLVGTYDGNEIKFYVNGEIYGSLETGGQPLANQDLNLMIGSSSTPNVAMLSGILDDIRIYNRALTDEEIQFLYNENGWD